MPLNQKRQSNYLHFALYLLIVLVALLLLLPGYFSTSMFLWDESRQANSALEMAQTNNFLYPTYNFEPEFWNTKPHLLIIIQAIFIKLFGPGLYAIRLPSLLATLIIVLSGFYYTQKLLPNKKYLAYLWPIIIPLSGFNNYHLARTGDYDALLTLFILLAFFNLLMWNTYKKQSAANYTIIWLTLAWFAKSFAVFLWLPGLFIFLLFTKQFNSFFTRKTWVVSSICGGLILVYNIYREWLTPGYFQAIWANEGAGRFAETIESHSGEWNYYLLQLNQHYLPVIFELFVLLYVINIVFNRKSNSSILGLISLTFIFLLSCAKTCLPWYVGPVIPLILASILLFDFNILFKNKIVFSIFILGILSYTYFRFDVVKESELGGRWKPDKFFSDSYIYLDEAYKTGFLNKGRKNIWVNPGSGQHEAWFDKLFVNKHQKWNWHIHSDSLKINDTVWFTYHPLYKEISSKYKVNQLDSPRGDFQAWKWVIQEKLPNPIKSEN